MLFPSVIFLFCFLPFMLLLYFGVCQHMPQQYRMLSKNTILFIGSLVFYGYGEGWLTLLLLFSIFFNWLIGLAIHRYNNNQNLKKLFLTLCVLVNIGVFFVFKYFDFTAGIINSVLKTNIPFLHLALPIGISFFTFQALSYVIDVYRGKAEVQKNPFYVGLYIALFPQLIAGPIVRYETIEKQIKYRTETKAGFSQGIARFITGLGKKVLIADTMAIFVDRIAYRIDMNQPVSVLMGWVAAFSYLFQIFFDFSSYSDMAIGLGKMFGFEFLENFNYPLTAVSVTDFWRRWHISLTSWFRDYIYIPLGGNRKGKPRMLLNMFIVWLLTGLWHGAAWTFILWGMFNFGLQLIERIIGLGKKWQLPVLLGHIYAVLAGTLGFGVLFRASCMSSAIRHFKILIGIGSAGLVDSVSAFYIKNNWMFFVAAIIFSTAIGKKLAKNAVIYQILLGALFLMSIIYILKQVYSPFIYFNF